jgi:RecA/RadA recombinase
VHVLQQEAETARLPSESHVASPAIPSSNGGGGTGAAGGGVAVVQDAKAQKMSRFVELAKKKMADLQSVVVARNATIESQEAAMNALKVQLAQATQQLQERVRID